MTQPQCNDWIHLLSDILFKTLKSLGELPNRNSLRIEPAAKMFCSTVLNVLYRDRWIKTDKNSVTVVKKTHNVKNNLICNEKKRILWLSRTFDGSVHDKKIADEQPLRFPAGITLWQDTGFLGHNPENVTVKMPKKKPKGKEEQKQENREISSFRIIVEHAIGAVKRCRIVKERLIWL